MQEIEERSPDSCPVRDGHSVDSVSRRSNLGELTWLETPQTYPRARATARSSKRARAFIILGWSQAASASASASARGEREEVSASVACNDDDGEYPSRQNARRAKNPACSSKQHEDGRKQGRETDLPTKPLGLGRSQKLTGYGKVSGDIFVFRIRCTELRKSLCKSC